MQPCYTASMNIVMVYNPKSGSSLSRVALHKKCQKVGITVEKFIAIDNTLASKLSPYTTQDYTIAVIGGDGTVSAVAGIVATTKATLLPLPGGTLNHFTRDLGVPQNIDEALARAAKLTPRRVDIASVNDIYFINNSSIGIYPTSLRTRKEIEPALGKWPAAVVASLRALVSLKTYRATIDDKTFTTPFVFVGNNRYSLNESDGAKRTKLNEAILTIYIAKTESRFALLKIVCLALIGQVRHAPEFDECHSQEVTIEIKRKTVSVSRDGEVSRITPPLSYKIHPQTLKLLA